MNNAIKKIVIIGPESTGKSTLAKQLAEHYNTLWVPEFARDYLEKNGTNYNYDDLLTIAKGQIDLEESRRSSVVSLQSSVEENNGRQLLADRRLFIDTDLYVMKVWSEYVFNKCHSWILNQIATRKYDLYLLCNVDLPWVKDDLREYPDLATRNKLYHFYKDHLINQITPWVEISGGFEERFANAIKVVDEFMKKDVSLIQ